MLTSIHSSYTVSFSGKKKGREPAHVAQIRLWTWNPLTQNNVDLAEVWVLLGKTGERHWPH